MEFEAGSQATVALMIDREKGHDVGKGAETSLEAMVGHAAFLVETLLRQGVRILLPQVDDEAPDHANVQDRTAEAMRSLAFLEGTGTASLAEELAALDLAGGAVVYAFHTVADPGLAAVGASMLVRGIRLVPLVYDARTFGRTSLPSAIEADYVDGLQSAGMEPQVMTFGEASVDAKTPDGGVGKKRIKPHLP